jgi:mono/diheme cytochrome c family protein
MKHHERRAAREGALTDRAKWGLLGVAACAALGGCGSQWSDPNGAGEPVSTAESELRKAEGQHVFRFDTFGDEQLWTDTLRMHEVIASAVSPATALAVGLKVDVDALPPGILATADLNSPATTVALLSLNAVVGVIGKVDRAGKLVSVGITCALCHSSVDNSVAPGIGHRLDGWANRDLNPGLIISLSPALSAAQKAVYQSWGAGHYDPRYNIDGINAPVVIPPAYGLQGVALETYTGDGPVSYWNAYVAVTQMGGRGVFVDPRIGVSVRQHPDLVTYKLPSLRAYQLALHKPTPAAGSFDVAAAERGRAVFAGAGRCASCHAGSAYTDAGTTLHAAAETGMDPLYATRSATKMYRTTPLRGLAQHPPYFHDGSAATLADVVSHYNATLGLALDAGQQSDLTAFLQSL